jgi:hypothetical protein
VIATAKTFAMPLMPHADAVLVFDARDAAKTGEYEIFSIAPTTDLARLWGEWEQIREGLTSTGRIPTSDVEFDEASGFRIRTLGLESFAKGS